jgi:ferredoxin
MDKPEGRPTPARTPAAATTAIVCTCEDTMPLDMGGLQRACKGTTVKAARHLCRSQLDLFRGQAARSGRLTVACTQEQPLFSEIAEDEGLPAALAFVNIRETAGWSQEAKEATPKIAALLALADHAPAPSRFVTLESEGVTLVLGRDEVAIEAGQALADTLDITVLLTGAQEVAPPRTTRFPVRRGRVRQAKGHLGKFELTIAGFAEPAASSRGVLAFGPQRDGLNSKADIVIDLTGGPALFTADDLREGYLRADPADPSAVARVVAKAATLVGTFDKPRFIDFKADLCAHSRSRITGCTRCLDLCPAGAISSAHDHVEIDPYICGGCGQCSAACPTGAASYDFPSAERLVGQVRTLLATYRASGGEAAALLIHDGDHGTALIDAAARFGAGLPANVLPLRVNEVTEVGLETLAAAFAYGAAHVRLLLRARPRHDPRGLHETIGLAGPILAALGYGDGAVESIETDDPDLMLAALGGLPPAITASRPASFVPSGGKREILKLALRELHRVAPTPVDGVALPERAPFGRVKVDTAGCTLCLSCVSACPTSALSAGDDRPLLRFDEGLCVQCGLCRATCPEKVMTLEPRIDFAAFTGGPAMIKEEEPFCCTSCGKAFGVKSTIDKIIARLEGKHWMYAGANARRLDLIGMCEDCRVTSVTNDALDPYAGAARPAARTSEDYFAERERQRALAGKNGDGGNGGEGR